MQMKRSVIAVAFPVAFVAALGLHGVSAAQSSRTHFLRIGLEGRGNPKSAAPAAFGTQGYLGIGFRDVSDDRLSALKLKEAHGAEIVHVDHDGPASEAGLREHDVVLQLNGQVIEGEEQLRRILRETPVGRSVNLLVSRDGVQMTVSTQMADRSAVEREAWQQHIKTDSPSPPMRGSGFFGGSPVTMPPITAPPDPKTHSFLNTGILGSSYTGAALEMIGPQLAQFFGSQGGNGLLVRSVEPNSPAATAGMRAGDVVVRANAVILSGTADWSRLIHENKGRPLSVVVVRDRQEQTLVLVPDSKKRSSVDLQAFPMPDDPALIRDQAQATSRPTGEMN